VDWNNDGKKDLITGEREGYVRLYLNTGSDVAPAFNGYTYIRVGGVSFDAGYSSMPDVVDWNNDTKKDLIVGEDNGRVHLLLNTGSDAGPSFSDAVFLQDNSLPGDLDVGSRASPVAVDWSGDGKKDLVVGDTQGLLRFFENAGTDAAPVFNGFVTFTTNGVAVDTGWYSRPDAVDWNDDGVLDIVCGCDDPGGGRVWLFRGIGPIGSDTNLTVFLPPQVGEGDGTLAGRGMVRTAGTVSSDLTVSLLSDDATELRVPASVVLPVGSVSAAFDVMVADDTDYDGVRGVSVRATATGFAPGTGTTSVADNEVSFLGIGVPLSPQTVAVPFGVGISALDINGARSAYSGTATLSGAGDNGTVIVSPNVVVLQDGFWSGNLWVHTVDTQVRLVATGAGLAATGGVFDVLTGPLDHFTFDPVGSPRVALLPFDVTLRAMDANEYPFTGFGGSVALAVGRGRTVGGGSALWQFPLFTLYEDARTQTIYPQRLVGEAGRITGLALDVTQLPAQTMTRWTIRMKHTPLTTYPLTPAWETAGWTVVYQNDETVASTGWTLFPFSTPFDYNGSDNLMVDFSFNNDSWTDGGLCRATSTSAVQSIFHYTDSLDGDPLSWSGTDSPAPQTDTRFPNIRLERELNVAVAPLVSGTFSNGVWTGPVAVSGPCDGVSLLADDGNAHRAISGPFRVVPSDADLDGDRIPDRWEWLWLGGTNVSSGLPGEDQDRDLFPDLHEFLAGTDPMNALSLLRFRGMALGGGAKPVIRWQSASNKVYDVDVCPALIVPVVWSSLVVNVTSTPPLNVYTDSAAPQSLRLYRVRLSED
jgi:hypothetical protein